MPHLLRVTFNASSKRLGDFYFEAYAKLRITD